MIETLKRKIYLLIGRAILTALDNTGKTQKVQVTALENETISDVERIQDYGFESVPAAGSGVETIILFPNGNRDQGICIKVYDRDNKPTGLNSGDSAQYDKSGNKIVCRNGGVIEIHGNGGTLEFSLLASLLVAAINSNIVTPYNSHTHGGAVAAPVATMTALVEGNVVSSKVKVS
jgi:phage baseplate assembly protein V